MNSSKNCEKLIHRAIGNWKFSIFLCFIAIFPDFLLAQSYWQQHVVYHMDIDFDASGHQFKGTQSLKYYNNSPDTLFMVFYHLYYNAFQPGSMMDVRSRNIPDPDPRIGDRISHLNKEETGYHKIIALDQEGIPLSYQIEGTVMEVKLKKPILPNTSTTFNMKFESQVPFLIRRTGRDNEEGISYSMSQWYPKMAAYDQRGWQTHPYIEREFYAPFGDFNVNITLDSDYVLGGTGIILNNNEVGHGYEDPGVKVKSKGEKLTWKFKAEQVHDFVWAADPNFKVLKSTVPDGPKLYFVYQQNAKTREWKDAVDYTIRAFQYLNQEFGVYGYPQFSVIQGGDYGMEYPMGTLITGERSLKSLVGVIVHEAIHSWFYAVIGTNESYLYWMDEGFTEYGEACTLNFLFNPEKTTREFYNPLSAIYKNYITRAKLGMEEPMNTHADHFDSNNAYSMAAYYKGSITLQQLKYVIGKDNLEKGLRSYYQAWKFKHPYANDFIRIMEKQSGLELHWYFDYWINTTHTIDYGILSVEPGDQPGATAISLVRSGRMPMPVDVWVTKKDGTRTVYYIPLGIMRGEKPNDFKVKRILLDDWPWTDPNYSFEIDLPLDEIERIEIDASGWMADIDRANNVFTN